MSPTKKAWATPELMEFGSVREQTAHPDEFPKLLGAHDGVPFTNENCPPGLAMMNACDDGQGGLS